MRSLYKIAALILCAAVLFCTASCGAGTEETSAPEQTAKETATEPGAITETGPSTWPETETEPAVAKLKDGMMIYRQDFEGYGDVNGAANVAGALGWKLLGTEDGAPNDWTSELYIRNGELAVENYSDAFDGNDSFALMLSDDYMKRAVEYGRYTLQYDVTYTGSSNFKRYMNIVTEYNGNSYNSFIFRICGYGNNQCYYFGDWYTYDSAFEGDAYAAQKKNTEDNTTIAYKLLGIESEVGADSAINNFRDMTVTIRVCREVKAGCTVYMKTADMDGFVLVSQTDADSDACWYIGELTGAAVCFKAGGRINGRMDNIAMWLGFGEMPANTAITYIP